MKKSSRGIVILMVCLMVLAVCPIQAFAAGKIMPDNDVMLTISYKDEAKVIPGARFELFKVADIDEYAHMTLTPIFKAYQNSISGLSNLENLDRDSWLALAATLKGCVQRDGVSVTAEDKTDKNGSLSVSLKPGLYLIVGYRTTTEDYYTYTATPFMLFLPAEEADNNDWSYSVTVSPKYEKDYNPPDEPDEKFITRKALKIWDDEGFEYLRPKSVTVQLLKDGEVYDEQILSEENNWRYAWDNLNSKYEWQLTEKEVSNYTTNVTLNGITFTITNTAKPDPGNAEIIITKKLTGSVPPKKATFTFIISALSSDCPMPGNAAGTVIELSIAGAGTVKTLPIQFTKPGNYVYTVFEKNSGENGYTYDTTVYNLSFAVTVEDGKMNVKQTITDNKGMVHNAVIFSNHYGNKLPQTGALWWPVILLTALGTVILSFGLLKAKQQKR